MSGGASSIRWLQVGKSSSATTAPGAYKFVDPQGDITMNAQQTKLDVDLQRDDGDHAQPVLGPKTGDVGFSTLVRGKGTNQADGEASDPPDDLEILLDCLMGVAASARNADTTGAGNATGQLAFADTSEFSEGTTDAASGIMIDNGAEGWIAREVETITTNTWVAVDRSYLAQPADTILVQHATSWYLDADSTDPTSAGGYVHTKLEGENWMREHKGCGVACTLSAPPGGLAAFNWTLTADDWADSAEEAPSYSAVTTEPGLTVMSSPFYIGETETCLIAFELDFGVSYQARTCTGGTNGQDGWIRMLDSPGALLTGTIYHSDATLATMQGDNVLDVAFQLGSTTSSATPGSCLYVRIPALSITDASITSHNGVDAIQFTGRATRPSSGLGSVRLHLFGKA